MDLAPSASSEIPEPRSCWAEAGGCCGNEVWGRHETEASSSAEAGTRLDLGWWFIYCKAVNGNFTFHSAMRLLDLGSPENHGSIEGVDQSVVGWILGAAVPSAVVLLYCCCDVAG